MKDCEGKGGVLTVVNYITIMTRQCDLDYRQGGSGGDVISTTLKQ